MSTNCIIPARLASKRFPGKMLVDLGGKPLVQWAFEGARKTELFERVLVATDSKEIFEAVEAFGGEAILTDPACETGTDRLIELQKTGKVQGELWVNWQGDEPFITKETIEALLQSSSSSEEGIWTLKKKITAKEEIASPHVVKVVCNADGKALYFSRSPIPSGTQELFYKHIGLYAYSDELLREIGNLAPCDLERQERLEQLRYLYYGLDIKVHETDQEIFGIDTKEELAMAQKMCYAYI